MTQTEGDEQYDLSHLEGDWSKGKHRKLCALFTREQFNQFVDDTDLKAESVETMGSLGAPGFGYGCAPAISFSGGDYDCYANAYVTPLPDIEPKRKLTDRYMDKCWQRIKLAVLKVWGDRSEVEAYARDIARWKAREEVHA
jgi:hypothetical protein